MKDIFYKGLAFRAPDYDRITYFESKTRNAIKRGLLIKKSCEICGCKNTIPHHEIYSDYLNVRWLCKSCHTKIHGLLKGRYGYERDHHPKEIPTDYCQRLNFQELNITHKKIAEVIIPEFGFYVYTYHKRKILVLP